MHRLMSDCLSGGLHDCRINGFGGNVCDFLPKNGDNITLGVDGHLTAWCRYRLRPGSVPVRGKSLPCAQVFQGAADDIAGVPSSLAIFCACVSASVLFFRYITRSRSSSRRKATSSTRQHIENQAPAESGIHEGPHLRIPVHESAEILGRNDVGITLLRHMALAG